MQIDWWRPHSAARCSKVVSAEYSSGRVLLFGEEPSWVSVLPGQNVFPRRYDPLVDNIGFENLNRGMLQRRRAIRRLPEGMPVYAN